MWPKEPRSHDQAKDPEVGGQPGLSRWPRGPQGPHQREAGGAVRGEDVVTEATGRVTQERGRCMQGLLEAEKLHLPPALLSYMDT